MKLLILTVALVQSLLLVNCEEDIFLQNLKHQFADVPRDVKLFDFLQDENNLKGLLGLHNSMCEQLTYYNNLKVKKVGRGRRDADTTVADATTVSDATTGSDATVGQESTAAPSVANSTVDANTGESSHMVI